MPGDERAMVITNETVYRIIGTTSILLTVPCMLAACYYLIWPVSDHRHRAAGARWLGCGIGLPNPGVGFAVAGGASAGPLPLLSPRLCGIRDSTGSGSIAGDQRTQLIAGDRAFGCP